MRVEIDTHTHSLASGHAYNTMNEMGKAAADKGLNLLRKVNNYFYLFYFLSQNIFAYHKQTV